MEKIEFKTKKSEQIVHHFYCDHCGVCLGTSEEDDDCYYESFGDFSLAFHTPNGWYEQDLILCDKCREKHLSRIYSALE